jgi:hypothetical protein
MLNTGMKTAHVVMTNEDSVAFIGTIKQKQVQLLPRVLCFKHDRKKMLGKPLLLA